MQVPLEDRRGHGWDTLELELQTIVSCPTSANWGPLEEELMKPSLEPHAMYYYCECSCYAPMDALWSMFFSFHFWLGFQDQTLVVRLVWQAPLVPCLVSLETFLLFKWDLKSIPVTGK